MDVYEFDFHNGGGSHHEIKKVKCSQRLQKLKTASILEAVFEI